jgi:hypothetical protein
MKRHVILKICLCCKVIIISLKEKQQKWKMGVTVVEMKMVEVFSGLSGGSSNTSKRKEI